MIAGGGAIAVILMIVIAVAERNAGVDPAASTSIDRTRLGASILFHLMIAGGTQPDEALQVLRRVGLLSPVTAGIDVASWCARYAQLASAQQRAWLLETAVQMVSASGRPVPLRQYAVLLDISFSLGFQTDALAKLREQYGFDYVDHAKDARPRSADRALFVSDRGALLQILGLESSADRQTIISAYRRLASEHHPDRVHGESDAAQTAAAAKFIEITRAYETLMAIYRD